MNDLSNKKGKWFPYIKPTRRKHDSGYRMFEVGYIFEDEKTKIVIGDTADHIWNLDEDEMDFKSGVFFNMVVPDVAQEMQRSKK